METIMGAVGDALELIPLAITTITGEPLLLFMLGVSLVPLVFRAFRSGKNSVLR